MILDKNDKNYWQTVWKRQRFLDMFLQHMYAEGHMSWAEILDYMGSGDFRKDVLNVLFDVAYYMYEDKK